MMNVLLISLWPISSASIGGSERFVADLANLLSAHCSVTILSIGRIRDLKIKNVKVSSLDLIDQLNEYSLSEYLGNGGLAQIATALKSFIDKNEFNIIHCNSLLFANLIKDIPVIHTIHTNREEFYESFPTDITNAILKNIEKDNNATYVAPSIYSKESFYNLTKKVADVVTHGFRSDIILTDKLLLRKRYGIPAQNIVFCVPSRLEIKQKGQEVILSALDSLIDDLLPFTAVLGGCDEQYLDNKKYLLDRYPTLAMVIENFSDKSAMYSLSDVIILPSRTESFGYAALESAMLGLPLLLSDIPPYREIAKGNQHIVLFENNTDALAKILLDNYDMITTHDTISPSKEWQDRYSEDKMLQGYLSLYRKCILKFNHQ